MRPRSCTLSTELTVHQSYGLKHARTMDKTGDCYTLPWHVAVDVTNLQNTHICGETVKTAVIKDIATYITLSIYTDSYGNILFYFDSAVCLHVLGERSGRE